jgi:hypothetical protein
VLELVPQLCAALQAAHDLGIVHRDVKPENVLVDPSGRVRVADFGLAKLVGNGAPLLGLTRSDQVLGTPHYKAPEQLQGTRPVDHRADLYSLGVLVYELLTGELPLGRFPPPSKKAEVPRHVDDVVSRALENDPEARYQAASDVARDLEAPTPAATPGTPTRSPDAAEGPRVKTSSEAPSPVDASRHGAPARWDPVLVARRAAVRTWIAAFVVGVAVFLPWLRIPLDGNLREIGSQFLSAPATQRFAVVRGYEGSTTVGSFEIPWILAPLAIFVAAFVRTSRLKHPEFSDSLPRALTFGGFVALAFTTLIHAFYLGFGRQFAGGMLLALATFSVCSIFDFAEWMHERDARRRAAGPNDARRRVTTPLAARLRRRRRQRRDRSQAAERTE